MQPSTSQSETIPAQVMCREHFEGRRAIGISGNDSPVGVTVHVPVPVTTFTLFPLLCKIDL